MYKERKLIMKHKVLLLLSVLAFSLGGCSKSSNENSAPQSNKLDLYTDKCSFVEDDLEFNFKAPTERKIGETYDFDVSLELTNRNAKAVDFKIDKHQIIRESNNAEYSTSVLAIFPISLECDVKKTLTFSSTLPTSIKEDKYHLNIKYGEKEVVYHFYEMPDEMRAKIDVKLMVDGELVETKQFPEGKEFNNCSWVSADYIYGCNEWFLDSSLKNKVTEDYKVNNALTIYGRKTSVLKYQLPDAISSSYVSGYNFIPDSKEIVIPKSFEGKQVYGILAGSFRGDCSGLKSIYIPRTITTISSSYNFSSCSDLEFVYFEGSQTEWQAKNEATYPSKTQIVFNTYK